MMLPMGTASYLMWKAFRGSGIGVKRLLVLVQQTSDPSVVSWSIHSWYRRGCCDGSSSIELLWRQQQSGGDRHSSYIRRRTFFRADQKSDNCRDISSVKRWLRLAILLKLCLVFTALHGMQSRYSDGNSVCLSVCPSVCPSVCQTRALWQNWRKLCLDFYTIWKNIYPSFLRRRMVGGGDPFYLKFWVNRPALERNRRFWTDNRS